MYINSIDNLFDGLLNNFYNYLNKKNIINKISDDDNFVKYQNIIINSIKVFINELNEKEIQNIVKNDKHKNFILNIIKRYCAYYLYLSIIYNYKGGRDLFITNLLESSKSQKDSTFQIENFFNSENNAKIIKLFGIIKDILDLQKFKTMERIKIILQNDPIKYENTITMINELGEEFITEYFLVKDNFHNIIKTIIFKIIYLNEEKNDIVRILDESEIEDAEYKYIEIVVSNKTKLIDFPYFRKILTPEQIKKGIDKDYYNFLEENKEELETIFNNKDIIDFMFSNKILIPISEEFLRYHKESEKYDKNLDENIKNRDATKIKYVINKLNKIKNINSSYFEKHPKLKIEASKLYFKQLEHRDAILYNDNEEVNIINKLELSEQSTDLDYLVDLENARNYSYINYKNFSKDGFILRTKQVIQSVRYSTIKSKKNKNLEIRVGHNNLPLHVIGVIFNPLGFKLECFNINDLENISKDNGFNSMLNQFKKYYENDLEEKKLYYWLFNKEKDVVVLEKYKNVSTFNNQKFFENILVDLFTKYIEIIKDYLTRKILQEKDINLYKSRNLITNYVEKHFSYNNININLRNDIISSIVKNILKDVELKEKTDEEPKYFKLPVSDKIKKSIKKLKLTNEEEDIISLGENKLTSICNHYLKWSELGKISRKNDEVLNQAVFDFVKQYVRVNDRGDYVCKSCGEMLNLKKYVYEGTYVKELDTFLTTNLSVSQNLHEIPKYSKYTRSIRNIEKNIEKLCYTVNLLYYLGNTPIIKLRRKMVIKDVIDLILIHTKTLKQNSKNRIENASKNYNIHKDLTNLFFFELKDDIFLTSSTDTDYYKIIKFNNIIAYILLIIISDMNVGQILTLKDDKSCNFYLYDRIGKTLFENLFIRIDEKVKISIKNIPLLGYVLFYFSCMLTNNYIWLWNSEKKTEKYNVQKIIIHTMVDLMNSVIEANMKKDKDFLYEIIVNRLLHKIKSVYNDKNVLELLKTESLSNIKIDKDTNKIGYIIKKEKILNLPDKFINEHNDVNYYQNKFCYSVKQKFIKKDYREINNKLNLITNCINGDFHQWKSENNDLICTICNKKYSELNKQQKETSNEILDKIKYKQYRKLADTYCLSGDLHEIEITTGVCNKCKVNIEKKEYTNNELIKLEKNLKEINNKKILENIKNKKKREQVYESELKNTNKIYKKLDKRYLKNTNNKLVNFIDDFIDLNKNIIGSNIKINNKEVYLSDTLYEINNDYLGNTLKKSIKILSSDKKIMFEDNNEYFKKSILYYHDKMNNVYVYYDNFTKNYLGYSKDNKEFKTYKSEAFITIRYSIKDMILNLGLQNKFINVFHLKKELNSINFDADKVNSKNILNDIIRSRISNLNYIINKTKSILEKIKNSNKIKKSTEFNEEEKIVLELTKVLKNFKTKNKENKKGIFKNIDIITNNTKLDNFNDNIKLTFNKNYFDSYLLNKQNNYDNKLIFYYLYNLERLINYNEESMIKTNISSMIMKIIYYNFNQFYIPFENNLVRKFDHILSSDTYIDDSMIASGYYQDLINTEEIDDRQKEDVKDKESELQEEMTSLDIDDYDEDDVFDDNDVNEDVVENLMNNE